MAHLDRNVSGLSAKSGHSHASSARSRVPPPSKPASTGSDMFSAASAGVMSMLKTSTDSGDIGDLSFNTIRLPAMPRPTHRRGTNVARLSSVSSQHSNNSYTPSQVSKRYSNPQAWDTSSVISQATHGTHGTSSRHGPHGSLTSLQTMQTLPPYASDYRSPPRNRTGPPSQSDGRLSAPFSPDGRSYSLTQPQPLFAIRPHRSATSLRSQGSGPYPPQQRNPYAYPARLRRPGYRAPSPALSDYGGPPHPSAYGTGIMPGDTSSLESGFDLNGGHSYGHHQYPPSRHPHAPHHRPADGPFYPPQVPPHGRNSRRPPLPSHNSDYTPGAPPVPRYGGHPSHIPRQAPYLMMPHPADHNRDGFRTGQVRGAPAFSMPPHGTTQLPPPRMYTPQVDSLPSSSEPGSSAPPSSNPPTPRDPSTIQVTVDPIFIDPAFSDSPDDHSEANGFPNYLKYAETVGDVYEMDAMEPATIELPAEPTVARGGFVQRIKDLLEDRSTSKPHDPKQVMPQQSFIPVVLPVSPPKVTITKLSQKTMELPTTQTSSYDEPVELPTTRASSCEEPVELPTTRASSYKEPVELPTTRTLSSRDSIESLAKRAFSLREPVVPPVVKAASIHDPIELEAPTRLTRELIKADTAPSSSDPNTITSQSSRVEDEAERTTKQPQPALLQQVVGCSEDMSVTMASSPPHMASGTASIDATVTSQDFSEAAEMDYAIQLDIPGHFRPEPAKKSRPKSLDIILQYERPVSGSVSPFRPSEEAMRDSMVSPLPTQTLHMPTRHNEHGKVPGSFPIDQVGPAEPPSPLSRPMSGHLSTDLSGTHFSLPPDLSLLNEQDATASEVVMDVAVRFSIPHTEDHGKPQLVSVASAVESTVPQTETVTTSKKASNTRSLRESFFNVEKVAPLQIKKTDAAPPGNSAPSSTDSTDLSSFIRRSFPRRQSQWPNDRAEPKQYSSDSGTESRFPGMKSLPGHLPGLKEESQEDMSIKDYRSSGLRLATPPSSQAKATYGNHKRFDDAFRASYLPPARAPRMTLAELRNIPSLNFSRLDLIDKLNEALDVRSSRFGESTRRREISGIYCPSPLRPSSTEALRERYTSFFAKPEEFKVPEPTYSEIGEEEGFTTGLQNGSAELSAEEVEIAAGLPEQLLRPPGVYATAPSLRARSPSVRPLSRPLSPEELISVANEVNRLSIPSVAALSERLSELLPSIKHLILDSSIADERAIKETLNEIHQLGGRPDSDVLAFVRSSTGLRQMAAAADDIVTNGTHDSTAFDAKIVRLIKELPPLSEYDEQSSLTGSGLDRNTSLNVTEALFSVTATESQMLKPALLRVKSLNDIEDTDQMHPGFPGSATKRSLAPSNHHSRPWNLDEYYPWTGKSISIDIDFPRPILRRNTSASTNIRRSKVSSDSTSEKSETLRTIRARSPLIKQTTTTMLFEASPTIDTTIQSRKTSKRSLIGSLSRKIGLGGNKSKSIRRTSLLPELPGPTKPGDRYPSTALVPPNTFNYDEVRSFFSDSTSDTSAKRKSLRKHINTIRSRLPGGPATFSASRIHSLEAERNRSTDNRSRVSQTQRSGSLYDDRFAEPSNTQTYEGMVGMGKVEFRVKRVTERLKLAFLKTSEMIRTLSRNGKPTVSARRLQKERERAEWLDDSLYSGT